MFYCNTQETNSEIDIWKGENIENSSSLINNKRIAVRTNLFIVFVALAIISSILIISHTQDELLAKKTTGDNSGVDGPVDQTHCDQKGYPSCYDLGYSDGQNAPGTSCPSGHSETYCNGYDAASLSGNSSSQPSFVTQNPKTKINQGAANNADINVNNSYGTHITNEQTIKQSVRINNEINNLIRNSQVNKIIKENTVSAPQQPLTDLLTVKLAKSSMSSGSLISLADVEPYRVIGGHITANLPSSLQQNIVVAQISNGKIQHAVILDLKQIIGSNLDQNSLYETSLGSSISGTNPFTGNPDEVSSITNLFLWNNNQQTIAFDNANGVTMDLIYR